MKAAEALSMEGLAELWGEDPEFDGVCPDNVEDAFVENETDDTGRILECKQTNEPVHLNYNDLVDQVEINWPEEYEEKSRSAWYQAVRRWCQDQGLTLRKPNHTNPVDPEKLAASLREFRRAVRDAVKPEVGPPVKRSAICNMDETAVRIFALMILTIHWRNTKRVAKSKRHSSKLTLSMPTIWWGDGRVDYVVVWTSKETGGDRWQDIFGIKWFRADSKLQVFFISCSEFEELALVSWN